MANAQTDQPDGEMKTTRFLKCVLAVLMAGGAAPLARSADAPANPVGGDKRPTREELQKLSPEERQTKLKEWREKMTPEQREAQRKTWRERMEKKIEELKKKKTDGTITPQEEKQLERVQEMLKRGEQGGGPGGSGNPAGKPVDKPVVPAEPK